MRGYEFQSSAIIYGPNGFREEGELKASTEGLEFLNAPNRFQVITVAK